MPHKDQKSRRRGLSKMGRMGRLGIQARQKLGITAKPPKQRRKRIDI